MKALFLLLLQGCMLAQLPAQRRSSPAEKPDPLLPVAQLIATAQQIGQRDTAAADKLLRQAATKALRATDFYAAGSLFSEIGELHFRHQAHNRSLGAFIKAKDYFGKANATREQGVANFKLGRAQYYRGNYKLASGHLRYAMQVARQHNLKALEADVLEYIGILYHAMPVSGYQSSVLLKKSLALKQQLGDQKGALRILQKLADVYYDASRFDSTLHFSNAAVALADGLGLDYDATLSRLNSIPALLRCGKRQEAAQQLILVARAIQPADVNLSLRYHVQAGNLAVAVHDTATARNQYDSALAIALEAGFPELTALVYKNEADAYYHYGDFKKAYAYSLALHNSISGPYAKEALQTLKELEAILKTSIAEDEVKQLTFQNKMKEAQLKNERAVRWILTASAAGLLLSAFIILLLYRRQRYKNNIIEKQAADLKTLMKEMHHRVKNNLQVVSSLLDLQAHTIGNSAAAEAIRESRNRVQTMALIHQRLNREGMRMDIEMDAYINNLAQHLFSAYNVRKDAVLLQTKTDPVTLPVDAVILIGLVLNELISNALKHAFGRQEQGTLRITLEQRQAAILLEVRDDGEGFPQGFSIAQADTFGYKLIKAFARKLKARLHLCNDGGACVQLHMERFKSPA